ncbi:MAG: ATP-dependent RNA helicase, partial [Sphingobium sp.]
MLAGLMATTIVGGVAPAMAQRSERGEARGGRGGNDGQRG